MASINRGPERITTHEGGTAKRISPERQLERSVMACLLWEDSFYESGEDIGDRIKRLCQEVPKDVVMEMAKKAKWEMGLRHVPLWMAVSAKAFEKDFLKSLIRRPDDMTEMLSMYWKDGKKSIPKQMKLAFQEKFNEFSVYQLSKYRQLNREIKLRDVLKLVHPRPEDIFQAETFKGLVDGTLSPPNTWETRLMLGEESKKDVFEDLMRNKSLGALAFLRNLRGMQEAGVDSGLIKSYARDLKADIILPFQFIQAAQYAYFLQDELETLMLKSLKEFPHLKGTTTLIVDVSGSMNSLINSGKLQRDKAAQGLAIALREICDDIRIFAFGDTVREVPNRRGFALGDQLKARAEGTQLKKSLDYIKRISKTDRYIVITDEQTHDGISQGGPKHYLLNVAAYQNGVGYYDWIHIDGWSFGVIKYIASLEEGGIE